MVPFVISEGTDFFGKISTFLNVRYYSTAMKYVIPGGSGQVGRILAREFSQRGDEVVVLSRDPQPEAWKSVLWDDNPSGSWASELEGADVLINLAGRSVNCRYHPRNRSEILESRVKSTEALGKAIAACQRPPRVWLQSSTATIYSHRYDAPNDEADGILGGSEPNAPDTWQFSIEVAQAWETAASQFQLPHTRTVLLRSAMIMSPDKGGVFDTLLGLVRKGLGGTSGNGRQFVSWIHEHDFVRALDWILDHPDIHGPINLSSPNPLPNKAFMKALRKAWGIPVGLPAFEWMLEIGAIFMRTETELILKSRRVTPGILLKQGFQFMYPEWETASQELCKRWQALSRP